MNHHTFITCLLVAALALLASSCASTPVYSDGSYGLGEHSESVPRPAVQAQPHSEDSALVKGYGYFVRGIQNVAYGTMLTAAIVLYPFAAGA